MSEENLKVGGHNTTGLYQGKKHPKGICTGEER